MDVEEALVRRSHPDRQGEGMDLDIGTAHRLDPVLAEEIERSSERPVFIERRGHRAAVLISPEDYERMLDALEGQENA